ncbi:dolichyl-P-Man:Man(5)GlcNAc(2)-PP-dolichyl mannosyltransferase [Achlya hypogyna]|uniref:dolichyl-P-Man:Man5GlcNAc2-PP-dolichol alpha-1,3-mannosyltransferase n=1 Tax=Achlya hypogyna TaxID=1202772 RepID=A0A1V9ZFK2_ACHHY|nr:dolichyl-P-Man:Man(5)GlcNAc(2)-PP-dolichyl mannosyltransferase [Achlya hypogyna]
MALQRATKLKGEKRATRIDKDIKKVSNLNRVLSFMYDVLWSYRYFKYMAALLLLLEAGLGYMIIQKIPYTEIDWKAYMEQVEQFKAGERDYVKIRGGTGPLVYPAGHVYIFSLLHTITNAGQNIRLAQYLFLGFYLIMVATIFAILYRARMSPPWTAMLVCTSKRLHSIYMLRLFNDGIAMMLLFIAVYLFCRQKWRVGCLVYSLAVSVKMNVLLFAPALFFLLLQSSGILRTAGYLALCAAVQVALAIPFLNHNAWSYVSKAFEFSRVFTYQWTVNWRFVSEEVGFVAPSLALTPVFVSKWLSMALLGCHLLFLALFIQKYYLSSPGALRYLLYKPFQLSERQPIRAERIVTSMFAINFIGIAFSRTLHYQFYAWFYPTLPYLIWKTNLPLLFKAKILIMVEFAFNTFPSTDASSLVLQLSQLMLLVSLYTASDESKYQTYLDAEARENLLHFMNDECFDASRQFAMYYGSVTEDLAEGASVVSIDEQEVVLRLPKMNFTLAIGFGSSAPVTSEGYARRVLSGMLAEAEDGLQKGTNMADVLSREMAEVNGGELRARLRQRKP